MIEFTPVCDDKLTTQMINSSMKHYSISKYNLLFRQNNIIGLISTFKPFALPVKNSVSHKA